MTNQRSTGNHRPRRFLMGTIPNPGSMPMPRRMGSRPLSFIQSDRYPNGDHLQV